MVEHPKASMFMWLMKNIYPPLSNAYVKTMKKILKPAYKQFLNNKKLNTRLTAGRFYRFKCTIKYQTQTKNTRSMLTYHYETNCTQKTIKIRIIIKTRLGKLRLFLMPYNKYNTLYH